MSHATQIWTRSLTCRWDTLWISKFADIFLFAVHTICTKLLQVQNEGPRHSRKNERVMRDQGIPEKNERVLCETKLQFHI